MRGAVAMGGYIDDAFTGSFPGIYLGGATAAAWSA